MIITPIISLNYTEEASRPLGPGVVNLDLLVNPKPLDPNSANHPKSPNKTPPISKSLEMGGVIM